MESEPPKADLPKRKRRWFQFSLRTLLVAVTAFSIACAYVGWQAKIVIARKVFRDSLPMGIGLVSRHARNLPLIFDDDWLPSDVSWLRKSLGDETIMTILVTSDASAADIRKAKELHPEARCFYWPGREGERERWEPAADEGSPTTQP